MPYLLYSGSKYTLTPFSKIYTALLSAPVEEKHRLITALLTTIPTSTAFVQVDQDPSCGSAHLIAAAFIKQPSAWAQLHTDDRALRVQTLTNQG